jgi:hypothetical protein
MVNYTQYNEIEWLPLSSLKEISEQKPKREPKPKKTHTKKPKDNITQAMAQLHL